MVSTRATVDTKSNAPFRVLVTAPGAGPIHASISSRLSRSAAHHRFLAGGVALSHRINAKPGALLDRAASERTPRSATDDVPVTLSAPHQCGG